MLSLGAFAQITVNGHVKDATGEDVIGATVRIVGQQGGTVTDFNGNFQLKAKAGAELQISSIGYQTATVKAAAQVEVILQDDAKVLDQVVVIGYGVAKKHDLTGSVTAIKPDDKNHGLQTSAQDMLQGKVAGVNIVNDGGSPGGGATIRIRGGSSLNASNDPLIVIDGLSMDTYGRKGSANFLASINPNDIESFTVLKDASATAIYGSRASNGVIIITTKKGRKGSAPKINYNGNVSISKVKNTVDVLDANEYMAFVKKTVMATKGYTEAEYEASNEYKNLGYYDANGNHLFANTDWQDEIYRTAFSTDHNVSITGGLKNMPYRVSFGMTDQNGVLKKSSYQRYTANFSVSPSFFDDHLTLNVNGKYMFSHSDYSNGDAIGNAVSYDPTKPVYNNTDFYKKNWNGFQQWSVPTDYKDPNWQQGPNTLAPGNPVAAIYNKVDKGRQHSYIGNFEADYKIHGFEDLHLHANLAGEYSTGGEYNQNNPQSTYGFYYGGNSENKEKKYNVLATAYAQYTKDFNKANHFDIMGGYEYSHMKYWGDQWSKSMYPTTFEGKNDAGEALAGTVKSYDTSRWKGQTYLVSWYGRANYSLLDRYLLTFTARYDGSSRFADGHRWGFFPSAAFAWRVKEESFLRDVDAVSDFKFRLGWGKTGQQDTGKEYYTATYKKSTSQHHLYPIGGGNDGILYRPLAYNDELTWETTTTWNVGIDYGMFNQRLTLNLDAYYRKTTDLLSTTTISAGQNFDNALLMNAGSLENKGFEVAVTGRPIQTKDWFVELSVNAAYNKNEITELAGGRDMIEAGMQVGQNQAVTYHKVGKPANSFFVYQQVYDQNGRPIMGCYVDRNGDGVIDENDKYFYKNIVAPWTGGFSFKISYKNWDLGSNFRASFGNYLYNGYEEGQINTANLYNSKGYYQNSTKDLTALGWTSYNYPLTDYFVQNGSFLKCDNITLGYNFDNLLKGGKYKGISGRIYASCSNVFTITKYKGIDPEVTSGKDDNIYPRCRTFLLGLNLNF